MGRGRKEEIRGRPLT